MATATWTDGGSDGDWSDSNNWTGGSGAGGAPANNDTVIIGTSDRDITTGLTTGLTGITLRIGPGYTGDIGTSSSWLDIDGTLDWESGGDETYITGTFSRVTVHGGHGNLSFRANASTDIGTLRCVGGSGVVTVGANAVLDDVEMFHCPGLTVTIEDNVTSLDNVTLDSGICNCGADIATKLEARGGAVYVTDTATVVTLDVERQGVCVYNASGIITTLNVYGLFDGRSNENASVTVSNATVFEGGRLRLRNGLDTWKDFTNDILYKGGRVDFPVGSTVAIT